MYKQSFILYKQEGKDLMLPNPCDENYELLKTDLDVVPKGSEEFKVSF